MNPYVAYQLGMLKAAATLEDWETLQREIDARKRRRRARAALTVGVPLAALGFGSGHLANAVQSARIQSALQDIGRRTDLTDETQRVQAAIQEAQRQVSPVLAGIARYGPLLGWTGLGLSGYGLLRGG